MPLAVFDFDGTLVYRPSSLVWAGGISWLRKLQIPFLYVFEKLTGIPTYQRKVFEWLVGLDVLETAERMKRLPPVPSVVEYFRELSSQGYQIIVMSYSPGFFVNAWLDANGLSADVYCPDIVVKRGEVKSLANDWATNLFLAEPKGAKLKALQKRGLAADVCVGDNRRRDAICDNYVDVRKLQKWYTPKFLQAIKLVLGID